MAMTTWRRVWKAQATQAQRHDPLIAPSARLAAAADAGRGPRQDGDRPARQGPQAPARRYRMGLFAGTCGEGRKYGLGAFGLGHPRRVGRRIVRATTARDGHGPVAACAL